MVIKPFNTFYMHHKALQLFILALLAQIIPLRNIGRAVSPNESRHQPRCLTRQRLKDFTIWLKIIIFRAISRNSLPHTLKLNTSHN